MKYLPFLPLQRAKPGSLRLRMPLLTFRHLKSRCLKPVLILSMALLSCMLQAQPQSFTAGYTSGIGFSDIHGYNLSGRWQSRPGISVGAFFQVDVTPVFSFGTEVSYITQSYLYKPYGTISNPEVEFFDMSSSIIDYPDVEDHPSQQWDYDFLRIPVYVTFSTPTRLKFSASAGMFLSVRTHEEYSGVEYYHYPYLNTYVLQVDEDKTKTDLGMLLAASLSWPISERFRIMATGRYTIGSKIFVASGNARSGSSEIGLGLAYSFPPRAKHEETIATGRRIAATAEAGITAAPEIGTAATPEREIAATPGPGATFARFLLTAHGGMTVSYVRNSILPDSYAPISRGTAGMQAEYRLDRRVSMVSGLYFERKGYRLNAPSSVFFRLDETNDPTYTVDTRVDLDYAILPLMIRFRLVEVPAIYIEGGMYNGFNLNARVTGAAERESVSQGSYAVYQYDVYDDIEQSVENFETGWVAGTGIGIPLAGKYALDIGVRYNTGVKDVLHDRSWEESDPRITDTGLRNGSVSIHLGLTFPINK